MLNCKYRFDQSGNYQSLAGWHAGLSFGTSISISETIEIGSYFGLGLANISSFRDKRIIKNRVVRFHYGVCCSDYPTLGNLSLSASPHQSWQLF